MTRANPVLRAFAERLALTPVRRVVAGGLVLVVVLAGCSVAREADRAQPKPTKPPIPVPTVVAPPQSEGLDGTAGAPGPNACTGLVAGMQPVPTVKLTAKPNSWNDGGLPALDLCTLLVNTQPVVIGISALPRQPDSIERLANAAGLLEMAPGLGFEARMSDQGVVFPVDDRAVRITSTGAIEQGQLLGLALALQNVVPTVLRNARQSDSVCQGSSPAAERFVGASVLLRRDYRVNGALTCIWGTLDATVSIVESFHPDTIPESRQTPPPHPAPIGRPGYYLPDQGELVFRQGLRVVRVSAVTNPARPVTLDNLFDIVEPVLPFFIR